VSELHCEQMRTCQSASTKRRSTRKTTTRREPLSRNCLDHVPKTTLSAEHTESIAKEALIHDISKKSVDDASLPTMDTLKIEKRLDELEQKNILLEKQVAQLETLLKLFCEAVVIPKRMEETKIPWDGLHDLFASGSSNSEATRRVIPANSETNVDDRNSTMNEKYKNIFFACRATEKNQCIVDIEYSTGNPIETSSSNTTASLLSATTTTTTTTDASHTTDIGNKSKRYMIVNVVNNNVSCLTIEQETQK
jgi:hypothetical protein